LARGLCQAKNNARQHTQIDCSEIKTRIYLGRTADASISTFAPSSINATLASWSESSRCGHIYFAAHPRDSDNRSTSLRNLSFVPSPMTRRNGSL
jgi:hypothetical protein